MRRFALFLIAMATCLLPTAAAYAQIGVTLEFQRRAYIQYERIVAKVTLRNFGGQSVLFGTEDKLKGNLKFEIRDRDKKTIASLDPEAKLLDGILLQPGESEEILVALDHQYSMSKTGRYEVKAFVEHVSLPSAYESEPKTIDVSPGVTEWSAKVGLPDFMIDPDNPDQERDRTYRVSSMLINGRKYLYVIIEDTKMIYSMRAAGNILNGEKVTAEIDNLGRLHLMIPQMNREFRYVVTSLDGDLGEDVFYSGKQSVPKLIRDQKTGRIYVAGGTLVAETR